MVRFEPKKQGATCPVTINGCVRLLSSPAYPTVEATPGEVICRLRILCSTVECDFWPEGASLLDERLIHSDLVGGSQKITDAQPKHLVVLG